MENDEIRKALMKRALGYESDEIVEEYSADENGNVVLSKRKITKKQNPPDVSALRVLLEQDDGLDYISKMTNGQLLQEKKRLLQLLKQGEEDDEDANV